MHVFSYINTSTVHWIKNPLRGTSEHNHRYNYLNFSVFHGKKLITFFYQLQIQFLSTSNLFLIKTGCSLIDLDVFFSNALVFIKSLNFGSI